MKLHIVKASSEHWLTLLGRDQVADILQTSLNIILW